MALSQVSDARNGRLVAVELKSAESPLDAVSLVNALSGWFYRTYMFAALANSPESSDVVSSYGRVPDVDTDWASSTIGAPIDCLETVEKCLQAFGGVTA